MQKKYILSEYAEKICDILESEGFSDAQIDKMLDQYCVYSDVDRRKILDFDSYSSLLRSIPQQIEHRKEYIEAHPSLKKTLPSLNHALKRANISMGQAKSIAVYTGHENIEILNIKRIQNDFEKYLEKIQDELLVDLIIASRSCSISLKEEKFKNAIDYIKSLNPFSESSMKKLHVYLKEHKLLTPFKDAFKAFFSKIKNFYVYRGAIADIDQALQNSISQNTVVYRGVTENYIRQNENYYGKYTDLIGTKIEELGYLSTSLTFMSSFAKDSCYVCFKIFVPKGSEGLDVFEFSENVQEYELLLNSCDLYVLDFYYDKSGFFDGKQTNIASKPTYVLFLLSKNRECYKDIASKESKNETESE